VKIRSKLKVIPPVFVLVTGCVLVGAMGSQAASGSARLPLPPLGHETQNATDTYVLRLNPAPGDHYSLFIKMNMTEADMPATTIKMIMVVAISYPSVAVNEIVQKSRITTYEVTAPGMAQSDQLVAEFKKTSDAMKAVTIIEVMNHQGLVTKTTVTGGDPRMAKAIQQFGGAMTSNIARFPAHPIKIGDTWQVTSGNLHAPITFKLSAVKTVNGRQVAELSENSDQDKSGIQSTSTSTMEIDLATGMINSDEISSTTTMQGKSSKMVLTIQRQ